MANPAPRPQHSIEAFDEKQFYLDEFRGRTLLFALAAEDLRRAADYEHLGAIVRELLLNDTRVIVIAGAGGAGAGGAGAGGAGGGAVGGNAAGRDAGSTLRRWQRRLGTILFRGDTAPLFTRRGARAAVFRELEAGAFDDEQRASAVLFELWSTLRNEPLFVGLVGGVGRVQTHIYAQRVAARLRVHKLVLLEPEGGLVGTDGERLSFLDEAMLTALLGAGQAEWSGLAGRRSTVEVVRTAVRNGVASVNLCSLDGAARELFTYVGSGTLFTLADYCTVERLGIEDFEEVERLIERGRREGLLKARTPEEVTAMLAAGYGAKIGTHHLAGIGALVTAPYRRERAGEIVGLYTITRFKREGVGARLVSCVLADARAAGLRYVFATTTVERAQSFFERQGFRRVAHGDVPRAKWVGYDPQRRKQVVALRLDLES